MNKKPKSKNYWDISDAEMLTEYVKLLPPGPRQSDLVRALFRAFVRHEENHTKLLEGKCTH